MSTHYKGLDYSGPGSTVNRDPENNIRYGVISQNSVMGEAVDDIYFGPHSRDLAWEAAVEGFKKQLASAFSGEDLIERRKDFWAVLKNHGIHGDRSDRLVNDLMECEEEGELWDVVEQEFNDNSGDHETNPLYEHDGYKITKCLDNDLMILKSPFFTYAQYCSPCVPGACNLDSPLDHIPNDGSNGCYCLGHDWFDGGKAPYPVFNMGGAEIFPEVKDEGDRKCRECSMEYNCDENKFCPGCGKSHETHGEIA